MDYKLNYLTDTETPKSKTQSRDLREAFEMASQAALPDDEKALMFQELIEACSNHAQSLQAEAADNADLARDIGKAFLKLHQDASQYICSLKE